jgi:hypothetical protein
MLLSCSLWYHDAPVSILVLVYFARRISLVLVCRGRYGFWGGGYSLHSGIEFGLSRTGKGPSGGGRRGWCDHSFDTETKQKSYF